MQVILIMFRADGERRSFSIVRDMTVIGRREDCDLRIPLGEVSRKHCRLIRFQENLRLEDLGSSNGTFHNGKRVQEAIIKAGDTIQVGPVVFLVQVDGVPADEQLRPMGAALNEPGTPALREDGVPTEYTPPAVQGGDEFIFMEDEPEAPPPDDAIQINFDGPQNAKK